MKRHGWGQRTPDDVQRIAHHIIERHWFERGFFPGAEHLDLIRHFPADARRLDDLIDELPLGGIRGEHVGNQLGIDENRLEDVDEVVGYSACKQAQGLHPPFPLKGLLHRPFFGDVELDDGIIGDRSGLVLEGGDDDIELSDRAVAPHSLYGASPGLAVDIFQRKRRARPGVRRKEHLVRLSCQIAAGSLKRVLSRLVEIENPPFGIEDEDALRGILDSGDQEPVLLLGAPVVGDVDGNTAQHGERGVL